MNSKLTIKIKRYTQPEWFTWFIVVMPFMLGFLNSLMGLPYALRYLIDVSWVTMAFLLLRYRPLKRLTEMKEIVVWISLFLICTLLVYLVQYQTALYYLWGFRNNFRFYVAFFAFAAFLRPSDIEDFFCLLDKVFWLNFLIALFQFLILRLKQDFLGGIFGADYGVNGYMNIFFAIILTRSVVRCFEGREPMKSCVFKIVATLLIAALAEMKFLYVEVILVIVLATLYTNFTWRKLLIIAGSFAAIFFFSSILVIVSSGFDDFLSFDWFWETATSNLGYTGTGDLNRLNSISRIDELWLTHWSQRIFGMGMGNCDTSSFAFVNTPFYEAYGFMHYNWFSYAIMYLECGWTGLVFYFGFFVFVFFKISKIEKNSEGMAKSYCRIAKIMAIMCSIIAIYNASLRAEGAYMAYFVLAIPFAYARCGYGKQKHINPARETSLA